MAPDFFADRCIADLRLKRHFILQDRPASEPSVPGLPLGILGLKCQSRINHHGQVGIVFKAD
jgi:hypothetical protein